MSLVLSGSRHVDARHLFAGRAMTVTRERVLLRAPSSSESRLSPSDCARPMPLERWCRRRRRKCRRREWKEDDDLCLNSGEISLASSSYGCEPCRCGCEPCSSSNNNDNSDYSSPPCRLRVADCPPPLSAERRNNDEDSPVPSLVFLAGTHDGSRTNDETLSSLGLGGVGAVNVLKNYDDRGGVSVGHCYAGGARSYPSGKSYGRKSWTLGGSLSRPLLWWILWFSLAAALVGGASASIMGDGCDWTGSGLEAEMDASRGPVGVRPVYLRCSQGAVSWAYPRGALRVLLRLAGGGSNEEFRGCVRLSRTWKGARLFLEGVHSLHPLFPQVDSDSAEPSKGNRVRCFQSRNGQAALYVEATPGGVSPKGRTVASFEYHLQPLPNGVKTFDPSEECRPCTMEEMTHAFCSSDLVTRGTIRSVESHDDPETSELKVRVTKLIRRTRAPPPPLEGDPYDEDEELQEEGGSASSEEEDEKKPYDDNALRRRGTRRWWDSNQQKERGVSVTLHVPTHCGARHGAGEFVFMAQRKLGQLRLRCAPRLEDWAELARKSNRLTASPCFLQA